MGLDMYLYKKTYVKKWEHTEDDKQFHVTVTRGGKPYPIDPDRVCYITEEVGYWRKFNALHNWFVENVQSGEDNCASYYVASEQLEDLLSTLKVVMKNKSKPIEVLEEVFPTASGFFFGSTDYDEWYFKDIEYTIDLIEKLLKEEEQGDYYYESSW